MRAQKGGRAGWMEREGRELAVGIRALSDGRAKAAISGAGTVACALDPGVLVIMHSITPERGTHYGPEYES